MGAGQIGGIATLLDYDFGNAAGFSGKPAETTEAQYVVYFLSQAMLFCAGALIEAHVVLTPAACVFGERNRFDVFAGTHYFLENLGSSRAYNRTIQGFRSCDLNNIAVLVLEQQYHLEEREPQTQFVINRVRYGRVLDSRRERPGCAYFGWGSRRNGYLLPLLLRLYKVEVTLLPRYMCENDYHYQKKFLCVESQSCKSQEFGPLCPDDVGSVLVCEGYVQGLMTTRLVDRPCGVGWLNMSNYVKFLTCAVDDAHDLITLDKGTVLLELNNAELSTPQLVSFSSTTEAAMDVSD